MRPKFDANRVPHDQLVAYVQERLEMHGQDPRYPDSYNRIAAAARVESAADLEKGLIDAVDESKKDGSHSYYPFTTVSLTADHIPSTIAARKREAGQ